ncbi:hypothetical protein CJ739_3185 [Mariniflexile rhizosphaerae]|uniref:DUF6544 family protein n=1 Tax=unclassified Mariniflexile TaxID=2643887 RepID=UPI000E332369|nr:DUF6544 family protein [Mariniflexile sp. TRM1-10]AXP82247.1 hypothetical protein CJ739_3185 [Mariniflexile sp. TRM1-10]
MIYIIYKNTLYSWYIFLRARATFLIYDIKRLIFALLIMFHGLIHLMGFIKAFGFANINQLEQNISKTMGLLWLFTAILLFFIFFTFILYLKKDQWFFIAILAIVLSQILIIMSWKDAKFGTVVNIIILLVSISAYGKYEFNKKVYNETKSLLKGVTIENDSIITKEDVKYLPEIVQKWVKNSGAIGKYKTVSVQLKQKGEMKTKPSGKWMSFEAEQHINVINPGFVWSTEVHVMPMIQMIGRDKFANGEAEILIKLASLIPAVNVGKNEKINQAAMLRYMAEIIWFPSAALNPYISWESIDSTSVKATFTINNKSVVGLFKFSSIGDFMFFKAKRYYEAGDDATLETWYVESKSFKEFNGVRIPNKYQVIWKLKEGDFNWLKFEITDLKYNEG